MLVQLCFFLCNCFIEVLLQQSKLIFVLGNYAKLCLLQVLFLLRIEQVHLLLGGHVDSLYEFLTHLLHSDILWAFVHRILQLSLFQLGSSTDESFLLLGEVFLFLLTEFGFFLALLFHQVLVNKLDFQISFSTQLDNGIIKFFASKTALDNFFLLFIISVPQLFSLYLLLHTDLGLQRRQVL